MSKLVVRPGSLLLGVSFLALAAAAAPASAEDLRLASSIAAVTVYPTGATVVRTVPLSLPAGVTTVLIDDLPLELEADSLKVEGAGDNTIAIASVETREVPADETADPQRKAIEDEVQALQDKLGAIGDRLSALDGRKHFLEQLVESAPQGFGKALGEGTANIDQWNAAATTLGDGLAAVADQMRAAHIEQRELNRQLADRKKALDALPEPSEHQAVRIALSTEAAVKGSLTLSYRTQSARWMPTYDAQLTTGEGGTEPQLAIVRRAEVTQETGEDWKGVRLTLSTAQALGGTQAPDLDPYLVRLYDPDSYSGDAMAKSPPPPTASLRGASGALANEAAPAPAKIIEAAADFGDFRAEYKVPGLVSVDSGEGARSLQIATEVVTPALEVRAVPMVSDTAYLTASFVPQAGAPLLPGKIALFRDGTFVGNGEVAFSEAGKNVDLGFGVDDRVHVQRVALDRQTGERGIFSGRKTDTRTFKITVENLHSRPIDILVLDRVPYAEDEKVSVEVLNASTKPTATNVDDKRGVLGWSYTYAPGESRDILNSYEVSWPADLSVVSLD